MGQPLIRIALLVGLAFSACILSKKDPPKAREAKGGSEVSADAQPAPAHGVLAAWSQLGPGGSWMARAIVGDTTCPSMTVDGAPYPMTSRGDPTANFPTLTCDGTVPAGGKAVTVAGRTLPAPKVAPTKLVVIGDTGCRVKGYEEGEDSPEDAKKVQIQKCNTPKDWPLAQVAQKVADAHPDLVIHVGDYHYREDPCPPDNQDCAGSFIGDTWASWKQDFFDPMAAIFAAAPVLLIRGNHELCTRAGTGWFRMLDPRPAQPCSDATGPYWVPFADHQFSVIDSANDTNIQPTLDALQLPASGIPWLLLHRPFVTPGLDTELTGTPAHLPDKLLAPGKIGAVVTGHKHLMRLHHFTDTRPPELISGNGGTKLEKPDGNNSTFEPVTGDHYSGYAYYDFGMMTFIHQPDSTWSIAETDVSGKLIVSCTLTEAAGKQTQLQCTPAP